MNIKDNTVESVGIDPYTAALDIGYVIDNIGMIYMIYLIGFGSVTILPPSFLLTMQNPQLFGHPRLKKPYAVSFVSVGYKE